MRFPPLRRGRRSPLAGLVALSAALWGLGGCPMPFETGVRRQIEQIVDEAEEAARPQVVQPAINPATGTYTSDQAVRITCATERAVIRYTIDGTDPTEDSAIHGDAILVTGHGTVMTIRAVATREGMRPSAVAEAKITIQYQQVWTPQSLPAPGRTPPNRTCR